MDGDGPSHTGRHSAAETSLTDPPAAWQAQACQGPGRYYATQPGAQVSEALLQKMCSLGFMVMTPEKQASPSAVLMDKYSESMTAMHEAYEAKAEKLHEKYGDKLDKLWDKCRGEKLDLSVRLGMVTERLRQCELRLLQEMELLNVRSQLEVTARVQYTADHSHCDYTARPSMQSILHDELHVEGSRLDAFFRKCCAKHSLHYPDVASSLSNLYNTVSLHFHESSASEPVIHEENPMDVLTCRTLAMYFDFHNVKYLYKDRTSQLVAMRYAYP